MRINKNNFWWDFISIGVALLLLLPVFAIFFKAIFFNADNFFYILKNTMLYYLGETLILVVGVSFFSILLGVLSAWIVVATDIPFKRFFKIVLFLPLAIPGYVFAFVYIDFLDFSGPVQSFVRYVFDYKTVKDYYFFDIRNMGGAIFVLSLALYPYVYMLAKVSFLRQSVNIIEAARIMGKSPIDRFFKLILPIAMPAIIVGASLVVMETLSDFGVVILFGINTLTFGIYEIWTGLNDIATAALFASFMIFIIFIILYIENKARKSNVEIYTNSKRVGTNIINLTLCQKILSLTFCFSLVFFSFVIPLYMLFNYSIRFFDESFNSKLIDYTINSVTLASFGAFIIMLIGLFLSYSLRISKNKEILSLIIKASCVGYAMPGAILAIGIFSVTLFADNIIINNFSYFNNSSAILSGGLFILFYGYSAKFLNIGVGSSETALNRVSTSMDDVARILGQSPVGVIKNVHIPISYKGFILGLLIIFVDILKELPVTLLVKPFNFETLATYTFQFASDELIEMASLSALLIVIIATIFVTIISKTFDK